MNSKLGTRGFTLLELLVALTIFAIISVSLYGSLTSMVDTKQHLKVESDKLRELQTAFRIIGRDVEQATNRSIRTAYQTDRLKAMIWTEQPANLELTTNGRRNPLMMKRSSLQRVAYRLEDELLIKDTWAVLDRAVDSEPFSQVILRGVEGFEMSFKDDNGTIHRSWPPVNNGLVATTSSLPKAVQIQIHTKTWGRLDRLFIVG